MHSVCLLLLQGCRVVIKFNCSIKQALQLLCVAGVPQSRLSKLVKLDHYCVETKTHICVYVWEKHSIRGLKYPKYRNGYRLYRRTHVSVLWSELHERTLIPPALFTGQWREPTVCKSSWHSQGSVKAARWRGNTAAGASFHSPGAAEITFCERSTGKGKKNPT